jgi:quercetin dioxygenase-like cupin family protein
MFLTTKAFMMKVISFFAVLFSIFSCALSQIPGKANDITNARYSIKNCVNEFTIGKIESTKVGYQYWFADKDFAEGKTLKLSVVGPHSGVHAPHSHPEDEFFFVLEGKAEFYLNGETKVGGPYTSFYCPSNMTHGIRNVGDSVLKYLVVKKYITN